MDIESIRVECNTYNLGENMATAIVRLKKDKQIVGVFAYRDKTELFWLADEVTDPYGCEYVDFKYGGIVWNKQAETLFDDKYQAWVNSETEDDAPHEQIFNGAEIDSYLWSRLSDANWKNVAEEGINYHGNA